MIYCARGIDVDSADWADPQEQIGQKLSRVRSIADADVSSTPVGATHKFAQYECHGALQNLPARGAPKPTTWAGPEPVGVVSGSVTTGPTFFKRQLAA